MNGHIPPELACFHFHQKVPVGTRPVESGPGSEHLLSVIDHIPSWGRLKSFELTILRDGKPALDMHTYSFGVTADLVVKFQIWDMQVTTIVDHDYDVSANIHYWPE